MERTHYTFLIFSGAHGKFRRVQVPFYVIHLTLAFSIVGILTVAALANSYTRMLLKVSDYNSLRTEREALKNQYRSLEDVVSETNAKLDSLRSLAAEVALTYGFGAARQARFPQGLLALATEGVTNVGVDDVAGEAGRLADRAKDVAGRAADRWGLGELAGKSENAGGAAEAAEARQPVGI